MTHEEALADYKKSLKLAKENPELFPKSFIEQILISIDCIEKQIPKEVVREHKKFQRWYNDTYRCPTCGESAYTESSDRFVDYGLDWCNHCGQALKWGG